MQCAAATSVHAIHRHTLRTLHTAAAQISCSALLVSIRCRVMSECCASSNDDAAGIAKCFGNHPTKWYIQAVAILHDAGLRRVQTAIYASHALALQMRGRQGSVVPLDPEEAARQFWNRQTNQASALEDASRVVDVPTYSQALQPTVDALNHICEHIVESLEGWEVPASELPESEHTADSLLKPATSLHSPGAHCVDKADAPGRMLVRRMRAGPDLQGCNPASEMKLIQNASGCAGYASAMRKATRCVEGNAAGLKGIPDDLKQANSPAVKFLDLLKQHPERNATEAPSAKARQVGSAPVSHALAKWVSKKGDQDGQTTEGLQRAWPVLAGPAFSPNHWFQTSAAHKLDAADDVKQAAQEALAQGPDVSAFPRPSDRLAFAHLVQNETQQELRNIRKPTQALLDETCLRSIPAKVVYTAREGINTLEHTGTLGAGAGSIYITTLLSRDTAFPQAGNSTTRMKAFMDDIQGNALLLQGLHHQSSPESAMRTLVTQAVGSLQQHARGRQSAMLGVDNQPLMMNLALEKVCSTTEERPGGARAGFAGGKKGAERLPEEGNNMPASLGSRAIV